MCGVLIGFSGNKTFTVKKRLCDENIRILILQTLIDDSEFILINLYNASTESEQIQTFNVLNTLVSNWNLSSEKNIIFAGDFSLYLDCSLDAKGGSPSLKKHSLSKLLEIKQKLDLCDIWRVRNPKKCNILLGSNIFSVYLLISYNFQEVVKDSEILCAMSTDHSALFCFFQNFNKLKKGSGLWKFNF